MTDGHLTDEQLSAHLDGASDTDSRSDLDAGPDRTDATSAGSAEWVGSAGEHLAGCALCRGRLAALEAVRAVLRTPVPNVNRDVRAASIASVLLTVEAEDVASGGTGGGRGAEVGTGAAAGGAGGAAGIEREASIMIPRRRPQILVGSAAAVLVLAAAIGVPLALSSSSTSTSTASAPAKAAVSQPSQPEHQNSASSASGEGGIAKRAESSVSNLGELGSVGALRSRVGALLPAASSTAPPVPNTGAPTPTTAGATAPTAPTGTGSGSQNEFNAQAGPTTTRQFERCLPSALHVTSSTSTVALLATASFRGTPALVYVFMPPPTGPATGTRPTTGIGPVAGHAARPGVVVTAIRGCKVLASTTL